MFLRKRTVTHCSRCAHSFGNRAGLTEGVQNGAMALGESRKRKHKPRIIQLLAAVGVFQHCVDHGIVGVVLKQRPGIAPFRDHANLRVVFKVGRLLRREVFHAERGKPQGDAARGDA